MTEEQIAATHYNAVSALHIPRDWQPPGHDGSVQIATVLASDPPTWGRCALGIVNHMHEYVAYNRSCTQDRARDRILVINLNGRSNGDSEGSEVDTL